MNAFATPEWDSNPIADKACTQLFKASQFFTSAKAKTKKGKKNKKLKIKAGRVEKAKEKQQKLSSNVKGDGRFKQHNSKQVYTQHKSASITKNKKQRPKVAELPTQSTKHTHVKKDEEIKIKKQKPKITHQTLFCQKSRKARLKSKKPLTPNKPAELKERISSKKKLKRLKKKLYKTNQNALETEENSQNGQSAAHTGEKEQTRKAKKGNEIAKSEVSNKTGKLKEVQKYTEKLKNRLQQNERIQGVLNKKQKATMPLRERMLEKLKGARFRYLNEQMYTSAGADAKKYFESDQGAYQAYHEGYTQQVARWPLNPLDVIIEKVNKLPRTHVIADFGCGKAKLAKSVPQTVHSFDLVAVDESVTACDMANVPLESNCVDVVVFCLSLMGTNLKDYLLEAHRVLRVGGLLKIAEVESRFESVDNFVQNVEGFGFAKKRKDFSHDLFCFLDFVKKSNVKKRKALPDISLNPCLYKRR